MRAKQMPELASKKSRCSNISTVCKRPLGVYAKNPFGSNVGLQSFGAEKKKNLLRMSLFKWNATCESLDNFIKVNGGKITQEQKAKPPSA